MTKVKVKRLKTYPNKNLLPYVCYRTDNPDKVGYVIPRSKKNFNSEQISEISHENSSPGVSNFESPICPPGGRGIGYNSYSNDITDDELLDNVYSDFISRFLSADLAEEILRDRFGDKFNAVWYLARRRYFLEKIELYKCFTNVRITEIPNHFLFNLIKENYLDKTITKNDAVRAIIVHYDVDLDKAEELLQS